MTTIEHSSLSTTELHEPKGADTATVNKVYVSDGAGSGSWKTPWNHGIEDHNDVTTTGTPIPLTSANTKYGLTNDGAGAFTNLTYKLPASDNLWDTGTNRFVWNGTNGAVLGDTILLRLDCDIVNSGANGAFDISMELAIGSAAPYTLEVAREAFKTAGTYNLTEVFIIYMGDANTLDYPARFVVESDSTGDTVVVNGWSIEHRLQNTRYV